MLLLPATPEVIAGFLQAAEAAPEELSAIANVMPAPPMPFIPRSRTASRRDGTDGLRGRVDRGCPASRPSGHSPSRYADMVRPM